MGNFHNGCTVTTTYTTLHLKCSFTVVFFTYGNHSTRHFTIVTVYCQLFVLKAQYNTALTIVYHSDCIFDVVFVVKAHKQQQLPCFYHSNCVLTVYYLFTKHSNHNAFCEVIIIQYCFSVLQLWQITFSTTTCNVCVPVAQWLEHCVCSAKVVGFIPREHMYWQTMYNLNARKSVC